MMIEHENVDVVRDLYRAVRERNFDALRECLTAHVKWFAIGPPDLIPTAGTRYGPEQVERYFSLLESTGQLQSLTPEEFIAAGDKVVAIGALQNDVKSTGSSIRSPWVQIFTLRNGRISEFRSFYDTAAVIATLDSWRPVLAKKKTPAEFGRPAIL